MTTMKLTCGGCGDSFEMDFAPLDKGLVSMHASMWQGHHEACGQRATVPQHRGPVTDLEVAMVKIAALKRELDDAHAKLAHDVEEIDAVKRTHVPWDDVRNTRGGLIGESWRDAAERVVRERDRAAAERDRAQAVIAKLALDGFVRCLRCGVALDPWDTRFDAAYRNTHTEQVCLGNVVRERDALRQASACTGRLVHDEHTACPVHDR